MAYQKTWNTDSPGYNAATARALNQVETQAAKMWAGDELNSWGAKATAGHQFLSTPNTARAFGTFYENGTDYPMLVIASLNVLGDKPAVGNGGVGEAALVVYDANQANGDTINTVHIAIPDLAGTGLSLGSHNFTGQAYAVVNPGEHYRLENNSTNSGSASIQAVQEFLIDATYSPQTWSHGEGPSPEGDGTDVLAKLNTYVAGVNAIQPLEAELEFQDRDGEPLNGTVQGFPDRFGIWSGAVRYPATGALNNTQTIIQTVLEDTTEGRILVSETQGLEPSNVLLSHEMDVPHAFVSNPGGDYDHDDIAGNTTPTLVTDRCWRFLVNASGSEIATFTPGQSDIWQEMQDLDDRAASGIEVGGGSFTKKNEGNVMPGSGVISNTGWSIVAVQLSIAQAGLSQNGVDCESPSGTKRVQGRNAAQSTCPLKQFGLLLLVEAGQSMDADVIGTAGTPPTATAKAWTVA